MSRSRLKSGYFETIPIVQMVPFEAKFVRRGQFEIAPVVTTLSLDLKFLLFQSVIEMSMYNGNQNT